MAPDRPSDADAPAPPDGTGAARSIAKDDAFHVLQNPRRRAVLRYLLECDDDRLRMRDVAEEVAAWEHDTTVRELTSDQRQRVYIALYQTHLPKLDDHGVVEYDQSRGVVEPAPLLAVFAPFLDDGLRDEAERLTVDDEPVDGSAGHRLAGVLSTLISD